MNAPGLPFPKLKQKRCRACRHMFVPVRPMQSVCDYFCASILVEQNKQKLNKAYEAKLRKETRSKLEALQPRKYWVKQLKTAMHAFIRARDEGKECISCPTILIKRGAVGGDYDAGHYRGVGRAKHLEFVEMNINGQCKSCNDHGNGAYHEQRPKMIERYGLEAVEALEADQEPRKHSIEELKELTAHYRAKLKQLLKEK